jgi:hypothetical protein
MQAVADWAGLQIMSSSIHSAGEWHLQASADRELGKEYQDLSPWYIPNCTKETATRASIQKDPKFQNSQMQGDHVHKTF